MSISKPANMCLKNAFLFLGFNNSFPFLSGRFTMIKGGGQFSPVTVEHRNNQIQLRQLRGRLMGSH